MKHFLFISFLAISMINWASQKRKVLIIGMDGVRSDALQQANTPNIDNLISTGFYTYESWHEGITVSGPSWSTIMCGVEYVKHGVTSNSYSGSNYNQYPYFTQHAKSCLPNLYQVQITQWAPMSDNVYNDGWDQKIKVCDGCGANSVAAAQTQLQNPNLDVLFVYFDECDLTGHSTGFSPLNPAYINAIETVDGHIGSIITALQSRPTYSEEDWVILITTDHGGIGTGHGGSTTVERKIWWVGSGNNPVSKQLTNVQDPGSYSIGNFNPTVALGNPSQSDIAVTALDHLFRGTACNPFNTDWDLDGQSWLDSLHQELPAGLDEMSTLNEFKLFPNPSNNIVSIWSDHFDLDKTEITITDFQGRVLKTITNPTFINQSKLNIELDELVEGDYIIQIKTGNYLLTKKFSLVK